MGQTLESWCGRSPVLQLFPELLSLLGIEGLDPGAPGLLHLLLLFRGQHLIELGFGGFQDVAHGGFLGCGQVHGGDRAAQIATILDGCFELVLLCGRQ